jgi:hypothetical protein
MSKKNIFDRFKCLNIETGLKRLKIDFSVKVKRSLREKIKGYK